MKNCLMISANFPPVGGVGVQRITKLVKNLPSLGWNPIVITVPTYSRKSTKDYSMMKELPENLEVHRPFYFDYRKIVPGDIAKLFKSWEKKYLFPDKYVIWNHFAFQCIKEITQKQKIDVAFVNIPPFSGLLLADKIKRTLNLPTIVNFRDPFSFNNYIRLEDREEERRRSVEIEKSVFPQLDRIICVTPYVIKRYGELFPNLKGKFELIPNGYDENDFSEIDTSAPAKASGFSMGYNGSVSSLVPIEPLLNAIYEIYTTHNINITLNIASQNSQSKFEKKSPECFHAGLVNFKGFLPHRESLENLATSNVLAIMFANDPATIGAYPGKVFEYFRMNRPILLLNNRVSPLARLIVDKTKSGVAVNIDNQKEIIQAILNFYELWKSDKLTHAPDWSEIRKFEYGNLTQKLVEIFEDVRS
jgi:glycosyltransferase involved in cell wall biosynthesis